MPELEVIERIDPFVRYKITYEDGEVIHTHRDCSAEIAEAREKHVSLASVLAASVAVPDLKPREVVLIKAPAQDEASPEEIEAAVPVLYCTTHNMVLP